ncbi:MAG: DUF2384 domain-containing protein [bacterium]|nr:DUF2384 domain-containing protein [bacterium]
MTNQYTPEDAARVEKAFIIEVLRQAKWLNIHDDVFAHILAIPETDVCRMKKGELVVAHDSRSFKIGIVFARLSRLLCRLAHGDEAVAQAWLYNPNKALGDVPLRLIEDFAGLHHVIEHLKSQKSLT